MPFSLLAKFGLQAQICVMLALQHLKYLEEQGTSTTVRVS